MIKTQYSNTAYIAWYDQVQEFSDVVFCSLTK